MPRVERSCWDRLKMGLRTGFGIGSVLKLSGSEAEFTKKWNYTLTMGGFYGMQIILLIKLLKKKKMSRGSKIYWKESGPGVMWTSNGAMFWALCGTPDWQGLT